jgi:hypothetical protein
MIGTYIVNKPKNTVFFIVKYRIYPIYPVRNNAPLLCSGVRF